MKKQVAVGARTRANDAPPWSGAAIALPLMALEAAVLGWVVWTRLLPWWVLPAWAVLSFVAFAAYAMDKNAANEGAWRTKESTLHFFSLAGGWPGAWAAQQLLRHKSRKQPFRAVYWATVVFHCAAVGGWIYWVRTA